jgi:hypothetical protein
MMAERIPAFDTMTPPRDKGDSPLKALLPAPLKPHAKKIGVAFCAVMALLLFGLIFGFGVLVNWFIGIVFLVVFMAAWVFISDFFTKMNR